jgi:hypothetical protein
MFVLWRFRALWRIKERPQSEICKGESKMSKSKKGKNPAKTSAVEAQTPKSTKQSGRREFLRSAGVMGAGAVIAAAGLSATAKAQSPDDMLNLDVKLDAEKIQAIQACLAKGTLRISMSKTAAAATATPDSWLYD